MSCLTYSDITRLEISAHYFSVDSVMDRMGEYNAHLKKRKSGRLVFSHYAYETLGRIGLYWVPRSIVQVTKVSLKQLKITNPDASQEEVFARAERLGLRKCPIHVGVEMRFHFLNQKESEPLLVGMDPIPFNGYCDILRLALVNEQLAILAVDGHPKGHWTHAHTWLFLV